MHTTQPQEIITQLNWRAAVKQYDTTKKLTDVQVETLSEVARLAPSSFGLQPYKLIIVTDSEIKTKLRAAAFDQPQLTDASHIFVLANKKATTPEDIDAYVERIVAQRGVSLESLEGYKNMMLQATQSLDAAGQAQWASKQVYTVLGMLMAEAAQLQIDTSPMEGFDKAAFDTILGLTDSEYQTAVILAVGFRHQDDPYSTMTKVRKTATEFSTYAQQSSSSTQPTGN